MELVVQVAPANQEVLVVPVMDQAQPVQVSLEMEVTRMVLVAIPLMVVWTRQMDSPEVLVFPQMEDTVAAAVADGIQVLAELVIMVPAAVTTREMILME